MSMLDKFIMVILGLCVVGSLMTVQAKGKGTAIVSAICWEQGFNPQLCKLQPDTNKVWLQDSKKWSNEYFVSDTFITEDNKVYVFLISTEKAMR